MLQDAAQAMVAYLTTALGKAKNVEARAVRKKAKAELAAAAAKAVCAWTRLSFDSDLIDSDVGVFNRVSDQQGDPRFAPR